MDEGACDLRDESVKLAMCNGFGFRHGKARCKLLRAICISRCFSVEVRSTHYLHVLSSLNPSLFVTVLTSSTTPSTSRYEQATLSPYFFASSLA